MKGEHEALRVDHEILQGVQAELVAACNYILPESPAVWGDAHIHLRDLLDFNF